VHSTSLRSSAIYAAVRARPIDECPYNAGPAGSQLNHLMNADPAIPRPSADAAVAAHACRHGSGVSMSCFQLLFTVHRISK
jgi:hypothetical protein